MLDFADDAAAPFVGRIPEGDLEESWQLIEATGVRRMNGPAGVALLEHLRPTLGRALRALRLEPVVGAVYWVIKTLRRPVGRLVPDGPRPRLWP